MILARDEQHHDAEVLRRIARLALRADTPLPADLERDVGRRAVADIGECDDRDVAPRLFPHLSDERFHALHGGRVEDVREVVHIPRGGGERDLREDEQQGHAGEKVHAGRPDAQPA